MSTNDREPIGPDELPTMCDLCGDWMGANLLDEHVALVHPQPDEALRWL